MSMGNSSITHNRDDKVIITFQERKNEEPVHLPDYQFALYCSNTFGLNRGVYNTIDEWMYHNGFTAVAERRRRLLQFLSYTANDKLTDHSKPVQRLKFGKGIVINQLRRYLLGERKEKSD